MTTPPPTLAELRAMHAAMTPGTWDDECWDLIENGEIPDHNLRGIVALHNTFPALLALMEQLERALREAKAWMPADPLGCHSARSTPEERGATAEMLTEAHAVVLSALAAYTAPLDVKKEG